MKLILPQSVLEEVSVVFNGTFIFKVKFHMKGSGLE